MSAENVKVVVRCRPLNSKEIGDARWIIVKMETKMGSVELIKPGKTKDEASSEATKPFQFDAVFDWNSTQRQVYDEVAVSIINAVLDGYNGTIFAYGQTGSGKSFTMEGVHESKELRGIIPNSFEDIFDHIALSTKQRFLVRASYLEIYNENIRDLLSESPDTNLDLKEHPETGVFVKDLTSVIVSSTAEIDSINRRGTQNRKVGATLMNAQSSRSHAIFQITVEIAETGADGKDSIKVGKLNLVDLAGSERQAKTGATGTRLTEATKINLSLSALGNVISALVEGKSKHIPYRDSKLTRLLQNSLGGNSKTVMIANMNPASHNYDESLSTLRYADRAKQIKNVAKKNEDPKDAMLRTLQEELQRLKDLIAGNSFTNTIPVAKISANSGVDPAYLEKIKNQSEAEIKRALEEKGVIAEERNRIAQELQKAQQRIKSEEQEKENLMKKLRVVQEKILAGNLLEQSRRQEAEIRKREQELELKRNEENRLQRALQEKQQRHQEIEEKYTSLREEQEIKAAKIKTLFEKLKAAKAEIRDLNDEFQSEREGLISNIRELTFQLKLKSTIIDHFVPFEEVHRIQNLAVWNDELEDWVLTDSSNQVTIEKCSLESTLKKPSKSEILPIWLKTEKIINLELERTERTTEDYKNNGETRVQAALRDALHSELDGSVLEFVAQDNLPDLLKVPSSSSAKEKIKMRNSNSDGPGFLSPKNEGRLRSHSMSAPPVHSVNGVPTQSVDDNNYPVARGLISRKLRQ